MVINMARMVNMGSDGWHDCQNSQYDYHCGQNCHLEGLDDHSKGQKLTKIVRLVRIRMIRMVPGMVNMVIRMGMVIKRIN